jgi:hypothetical protein
MSPFFSPSLHVQILKDGPSVDRSKITSPQNGHGDQEAQYPLYHGGPDGRTLTVHS